MGLFSTWTTLNRTTERYCPPPASSSATASTIDDLGLIGALHLDALMETRAFRTHVAPTRRMALAAMGQLRELGVIEVPWPEPRREVPSAPRRPRSRACSGATRGPRMPGGLAAAQRE